MPSDKKDRSRRVLRTLKSLNIEDLAPDEPTEPGDDLELPPDPEDGGGDDNPQPMEPPAIFAPPAQSETQRKLRKTKVRRSLDQELQDAFGPANSPR